MRWNPSPKSAFKRTTNSKSSGTSFLGISCFLYLFTVEPKVGGTPHFKTLSYASAHFFFFFFSWMFCHIHTDRNRWTCFGEGLLYEKKQKYTSFHSWGAIAAWLDLFIPILGAFVYHSNHKYSDRYSSYWNWSLDCNANGSLKYCWNCCLGSSVLDLVLHHYSCWTKLLWKLSSQEASVCAADCDPWDRWSQDLFFFFFFFVICSSCSQ